MSLMSKGIVVTAVVLLSAAFRMLGAQEFRCAVGVNYQKLMTTTQSFESSDKKVFDNMKQAIEDFVNGRRWTNIDFEQQERIDSIRTAMERLPEKQRAAMQLRDFEGKTYKEISDIMDISEDQVKVNIFRARQTVRQFIVIRRSPSS